MQIKSILAGAAIALAASVGSASAAEQLSTLEGITAQAMTPQELGVVTPPEGPRSGHFSVLAGVPADPLSPAASSKVRGASFQIHNRVGDHSPLLPGVFRPTGCGGHQIVGFGEPSILQCH